MQREGAGALNSRSRILLAANGARVLHVAIAGEHHYSHGLQMASQLKASVGAERPTGVLVDLLEYHYEFGNDVCGLFMAGYVKEPRKFVPTCIVAIGRTRASMESLYVAANLRLALYLGFAASVPDGLAWLCRERDVEADEQRAPD